MCRLCKGPLHLLGALGRRLHLRCRDCGMNFSRPLTDVSEDEGEE